MKADATLDPNLLVEAFERRELVQSTAVIEGVAFPQATLPNLQAPMIAIARSEQGVPFNSLDGTDTFLFVALLTPEEDPKRSLHLLARLTRLFHSQPQLRDELCVARSPERLLELFGAAEALL
jgi:PTS system fructose-specific IIC component